MGQEDGYRGPGAAIDLRKLNRQELPPEMKAEAVIEGEVRSGMRCGKCRERVPSGFKVHAVRAELVDGRAVVEHVSETACLDPECGFLLQLIRSPYATAVERVAFRFLDDDATRAALGLPPDAPEPDAPSPAPVTPEPEPVPA